MTERRFSGPGNKVRFTEMSWASGESGALTETLEGISMIFERAVVIASNSTNAITYTVSLTDEDSCEAFSSAAIPENASTQKLATLVFVDNDLTLTVTPSGDPGASGSTVTVVLYGV